MCRDAIDRVRVRASVILCVVLYQASNRPACHSERSEESPGGLAQILRCAQDDTPALPVPCYDGRLLTGIGVHVNGRGAADQGIALRAARETARHGIAAK